MWLRPPHGGAGGAPNAKGRISGLADPSGTTTWTYAPQGRVASRAQTADAVSLTTAYTWLNGRMTGMTTPSGQAIGYTYQNGRLAGCQRTSKFDTPLAEVGH